MGRLCGRGSDVMDATQATNHSVFPAVPHGDTILVTPRGDASGFGAKELQAELKAILEWLEQPDVKNLIVDLGSSNYYGSQIIGAVNSMILKVRDTGGRSGVCELSDDMRDGINVLNLDRLWTFYDTRKEALADIATESTGQKAAAAMRTRSVRIAVAIGAIVVVAAVVMLVMYLNRPTGAEISNDAYETFSKIEANLKEKRNENPPQAKWNLFSNRSRNKVQAELDRLENAADIDEPLKTALLQAGRDCLLPMLKKQKERSAKLEERFAGHMKEAKRLLDAAQK